MYEQYGRSWETNEGDCGSQNGDEGLSGGLCLELGLVVSLTVLFLGQLWTQLHSSDNVLSAFMIATSVSAA